MTQPRIEPEDRRIVEEAYARLRHFGAVIAPAGVEGDDLLQEALVRTLRKHRLGDLDQPIAYLRRVMVNVAANQRRRAGVRARVLGRLASDVQPVTDSYPSDLAELEALPPRARAALYLAEIDGYPYAAIGPMLGCSEAAARKSASRARRLLRASTAWEGRS